MHIFCLYSVDTYTYTYFINLCCNNLPLILNFSFLKFIHLSIFDFTFLLIYPSHRIYRNSYFIDHRKVNAAWHARDLALPLSLQAAISIRVLSLRGWKLNAWHVKQHLLFYDLWNRSFLEFTLMHLLLLLLAISKSLIIYLLMHLWLYVGISYIKSFQLLTIPFKYLIKNICTYF